MSFWIPFDEEFQVC